MSKIGSKDTGPELVVRSVLHRLGFRFKLHVNELPGSPDIVLPKYSSVVFVNGCFWHGHKKCLKGIQRPSSNVKFWDEKIEKNIARDRRVLAKLRRASWNVLTVWECETGNLDYLALKLLCFLDGW